MYVLATSLGNLSERLEIVAREAEKNGCTFSISKFYAGRVSNIVSGHLVILDPSGEKPPQIGPDPARIEKLTNMQPHKTLNPYCPKRHIFAGKNTFFSTHSKPNLLSANLSILRAIVTSITLVVSERRTSQKF